jgi:hypothetical protein
MLAAGYRDATIELYAVSGAGGGAPGGRGFATRGRADRFPLAIGPYWLRFTYATPVLVKKY